jgi:hypothetical protein
MAPPSAPGFVPIEQLHDWNESLSPSLVGRLSGEPVSSVPVEPGPTVPGTTPVLVTLASDLKNCCVRANFSLPQGAWSKIVLTYSGQAILFGSSGDYLYDSSYRLYLDQVPVLFGTTPEYGTWTVQRDLTEYSAILRGELNVSFLLGAAVSGDYFLSNLTLAFYPVPAGAAAPAEPQVVIPLWYIASLTQRAPTAWENVTVPSNATNATLELWAYGFGADEFWWSSMPAYRAFTVTADGTAIATEYPFPFVNTGGVDLFLWRPVTAVATTNDPPQSFDVTGALPLLEGSHNLSVAATGITPNSNWIIVGALLVRTDANVTGAASASYTATSSPLSTHVAGGTESESASNRIVANVALATAGGVENVSTTLAGSFSTNISVSTNQQWENVSFHAQSVSTDSGAAAGWMNRTWDAPFSVDLGSQTVITRTTGGGYPEYANFTTSFLNAVQVWSSTVTSTPPGATPTSSVAQQDALAGANGIFSGQEELTAPNAALLLGITYVSSSTPRDDAWQLAGTSLHASYDHLVVASGTNPPAPYEAATVVTDRTNAPMAIGATISRAETDVGAPVNFSLIVLGGQGGLAVGWSGLPPGCIVSNLTTFGCTPTSAGTFAISATVRDGLGNTSTALVASLLVLPRPVAVVRPNAVAVDVGGFVGFNVTVTGGLGPFTCAWAVAGTTSVTRQSCTLPFGVAPTAPGTVGVNVTVTDAIGVTVAADPVSVLIAAPVAITVTSPTQPAGSGSTFPVNSVVEVVANVTGGVAPFTVTWSVNGHVVGSGAATNVTVISATTPLTVRATIQDAAGATNVSNSLVLHGQAPPNPSGGGAAGVSAFWEYAALGGFVTSALLAAGWLMSLRRRPSAPAPSSDRPTTK